MSWTRSFRRRYWDEERAGELEAYLEAETDENIARGMSLEEARYAAHRKLGNTTLIREEIYHMNSLGWLETLWQDVRFALRMLRKNPGATAVAVLSLAIAIGPNCALFSVVDRLILKPPPVQGVGHIFDMNVRSERPGEWQFTSYPDLQDYQAQAGDVASFAATFDRQGAMLNSASQRQLVPMEIVSENYFSVLGARAMAGRTLQESDAHFEGQPPAVISYSLWQRYLGGASDAVGKTLFLSSRPFSLVGIMPRGFRGPGLDLLPIDIWVPFSAAPAVERQDFMQRGRYFVDPVVRLRDGVDKARVEAVLTTVARRIASQYPGTYKGKEVIIEDPEKTGVFGTIILSLAGLVVLIACANIAGILMAQGEARRQEFAVRAAMGASRVRLVRQLIVENLLLSLAAGGVGLLAALWLMRALPALQPIWFISLDFDLHLDGRLLAYALAITLFTTLAAGLVPSLRAARPDLVPALKGDARTGGRRFRFRGALVIAQIAISQFLLVGAGLLFRTYQEAQRIRPGFDPERKVLAAWVMNPAPDKTVDFARMADHLREVSGVLRVSFTHVLPLSGVGGGDKKRVLIPGVTLEPVPVGWNGAGADYFAVMGTKVLRGRDFERSDSTGAVAMNETMARRFWGSPDAAVGKIFQMNGTNSQVLGVVEDGKYGSLQEDPVPYLFVATQPGKRGEGTLLVETAAAPASMSGAIRKAIHDADPDAFVASLVTLRQNMQLALLPYRISAGFIGSIAMLGIFLAGVGLYGLVSFGVSRRTHEIGVRVAMGAEPADVLVLVFRQAVSRLAIGSVVGLGVGLGAAQLLKAALYRASVSPTDPVGLAVAVAVVAAVGLLATYAPARRALRVNPMNALREE
ncbi:MAG TPA: ABC transporter permease [Terriglobia bacterium]|nr:ABC transporter permease [Terriglobia bacterium]